MRDERETIDELIKELAYLRELKTIFDNLPIGIAKIDPEFRFISVNKFISDFTGCSEQNLIGKVCYETVGEYALDPAKTGLEKICSYCKKEECSRSKRATVTERALGDSFVRVTTIPKLDDNGNVSRFIEIVEDITECKQAEAETIRVSQLAALGELAAGVAHEINNPLNGVINYAQLLAGKTGKDSEDREILHRIIKEGDRIAGIVKNLLSYARVGQQDKRPVYFTEIIADSLALTEAQILRDGINLKVNIPSHLPHITAQPQHIEQVFLNIISNARYALNQKYPGVDDDKVMEIHAEEVSILRKPYLQITFFDSGTGISSKIIDKVTKPFFSTKPHGVGTGLGLSISHSIINNHGGKLLIDSQEDEFTRIIIRFPLN